MHRIGLVCAIAVLGVACDPQEPVDAGADAQAPDAGTDGGVDAGPPATLCDRGAPAPGPFPEPGAWGPNRGPGGPAASFTEGELYANCAYLDGGDLDTAEHHNLVVMYDGYLLMPWAPEWGAGGLTFYDISDPCAPTVVGGGYSPFMRETHAIGFSSEGGRWAVVDQMGAILEIGRGGIQFWDVSDPTAPEAVADLEFPNFGYPDAYAQVTLSTFWQVPYVYVGGAQHGVYVVDATDPLRPRHVNTYLPDPVMRVGQVQAVGNLLVVTAAEGARTLLLDISDPENPAPIPGGDFIATDSTGQPREAYFSNFVNGHIFYANKDGGGGIVVWDVRDPEAPVHAGDHISDGNGGYVFVQGDRAFVGESRFAAIYDISDLSNITEITRMNLEGDLDTATPIGNVVVLSVDDPGETPNQASAIVPFLTEPDTEAPRVTWTWPGEGATGLRTSSRVGVALSEMVDVLSAHEGSVRLYRADAASPDEGRVPAAISAQEATVNVHPRCPLEPNTSYTLEVMAGGLVDFSGNALAETTTLTFVTGAE